MKMKTPKGREKVKIAIKSKPAPKIIDYIGEEIEYDIPSGILCRE
jgi:hypothetical protein